MSASVREPGLRPQELKKSRNAPSRLERSERRFSRLLLIPAALFFGVFILWSVARVLVDSFFDITPYGGTRSFVGLANFTEALTSPSFLDSAGRTAVYTAIVLAFEFIGGLAVALLFSALGARSNWLRTVFLYPLMIAPVVAGLLWRFLLIDNFGIVNELLARIGLPSDIGWLSDAHIVLLTVAIPDIWLTTPFMTLVLYAGLQGIPSDVVEAARIDGAGYWNLLGRIILPQLRPVIAVALIIRGVDAARAFDIILAQTGGGPENASQTLSLLIYRTMIRYSDQGLASAMSVLFLVVMTAIAMVAIFTIWHPGKER